MMQQIIVQAFGGPEALELREVPTPEPGPGEVLVQLTSIGMNHAELMARRGEYKLSSGDPPFTPGLEGGGIIEAVGPDVKDDRVGQRVVLALDAPRQAGKGTYQSHFVCHARQALPAPDNLPDDQLGCLWLAYLTAWGCLVWRQGMRPGQYVGIPAATSSLGIAAAQVCRHYGAHPIGLTTSPAKVAQLKALPAYAFDEVVVTRDEQGQATEWHRDLKRLTDGRGVNIFFDPVAAGAYLNTEIRALAQGGTIWIYGLLGSTDAVDLSPLIRKQGSIRGWVLTELVQRGGNPLDMAHEHVLEAVAKGIYRPHLARGFKLADVAEAHAYMETGQHIGKLALVP